MNPAYSQAHPSAVLSWEGAVRIPCRFPKPGLPIWNRARDQRESHFVILLIFLLLHRFANHLSSPPPVFSGAEGCFDARAVALGFMTTTGLVTQLLEQRETRTLQRLHNQLERLDVLLLDELGYVPFSKFRAELLLDAVSRAFERTSLIVTTNLPFEPWTEVLGSERLTGVSPSASRRIPMICSSLNLLFFIVLLPFLFAAELHFCHSHLFGVRSTGFLQVVILILSVIAF